MKIGILAIVSKKGGGAYQYTHSLIESLIKFTKHNYLIIKNSEFIMPQFVNNNYQLVEIKTNPSNLLMKIKILVYLNFPIMRNYFDISTNYKIIENYGLDIIISPVISLIPLFVDSKYIITIHDLQHKYYPEFFTIKERLLRDYVYKNAAKNALLVVCESNFVKQDIIKFLSIPEEKVRVILSPPPENRMTNNLNIEKLEEVKSKYNLKDNFLFYPANFWHHKNHNRLVQCIAALRGKYKEKIPLVFIGYKENSFENIMKKIVELNLESQVKWLGYIPEDDIPYLYKLATALVMPTLFESVSMPVWEAFYLGCPVVSSNVCALPEQVGDAGLLFDPLNVEDMAKKIYRIWTDEDLRQDLTKKGYERIKDMTLENYAKQWEKVIDEALVRIKT